MDTKRFKIVSCTGCHLKKNSRDRYQHSCLNLVGENYTGKTLPRAGKSEENDECLCTGLSTRLCHDKKCTFAVCGVWIICLIF